MERKETIQNLPEPTTGSQARSYAGLGSYLREFVPHAADKLQFLFDLVNERKFELNDHQRKQWQDFKKVFSSNLKLSAINWNDKFLVKCDASDIGLGAVLFQIRPNGKIDLVLYASRKLQDVESRYPTFKKEALAFKFALESFHNYLIGRKFMVHSDNQPLVNALKKGLEQSSRTLNQWFGLFQEYDFEIEHIAGETNKYADQLSRNPANHLESIDDEINGILEDLFKITSSSSSSPSKQRNYTKEQKQRLISLVHHENGHMIQGTKEILTTNGVQWAGMDKDIRNFVLACRECNQFNSGRKLSDAVRTTPAEAINACWMIDLLQLPESQEYKYVLDIVDVFSGFCILYAQESKEADEVAHNVATAISFLGPPKTIHSDAGTEFSNAIIQKLSFDFNI